MMDRHLPTFFVVAIVIAAISAISHAAISPQAYWQSLLPKTPMPNSIRERLQPDTADEKTGTSVDVGEKGIHVDAGMTNAKGGTAGNVGKGSVNVNTGRKGNPAGSGAAVHVGKDGVSVDAGRKGKPVIVNVRPGKSPFLYKYAASQDQLHDDPSLALFFLEKDLHPGSKFDLFFSKSADHEPTFLPRTSADNIPFSSSKFSDILHHFSIDSNSQEAQIMKETIKQCEEPGIRGETKHCATSIESMVDYAISKLGKNVHALETQADNDHEYSRRQKYTIVAEASKKENSKVVACHGEPYVYAVYYCHETANTSAYVVPLKGEDRAAVNAVAVCHKDTSQWNPKHIAFQMLKVMPGSEPICHFVPKHHIIWVKK